MSKILKMIILLMVLSPLQVFAITSGGLGVGASVPDTGYNSVYLPPVVLEPAKPAENLYLQDFWAQLLTEENAKRPLNHTQLDIALSYLSAFFLEIIVILILLLIFLLINYIYRKYKKAVKTSQKSVDKSLLKSTKK
jgi:hypothetical protein